MVSLLKCWLACVNPSLPQEFCVWCSRTDLLRWPCFCCWVLCCKRTDHVFACSIIAASLHISKVYFFFMTSICALLKVAYFFRFLYHYCYAAVMLPAPIKYKKTIGGWEVCDGLLPGKQLVLVRLCERYPVSICSRSLFRMTLLATSDVLLLPIVCTIHQCFSTFFASRTTLCNKKILGNTKQNFIITIMMFSSVLALLIY